MKQKQTRLPETPGDLSDRPSNSVQKQPPLPAADGKLPYWFPPVPLQTYSHMYARKQDYMPKNTHNDLTAHMSELGQILF